jgi:nucleotide-binding universal stress UspA family protein
MAGMPSSLDVRRRQLVVALDLSDYSEVVLEEALDQATRYPVLDLHVLTVLLPPRRREHKEHAELEERSKQRLHELVTEGLDKFGHGEGKLNGWRVRLHLRQGVPAEEIAGLAAEVDADLLVLGRFGLHARGRDQSVADRVLPMVGCPTLVVQMPGFEARDKLGCADCAEVRRESNGESWFCPAHADRSHEGVGMATLLLPHTDWSIGPSW